MKIRVAAISGKGRGVIAVKPFETGELIEQAPVLVLRDQDDALASQTILDSYVYTWQAGSAIAFGFGSLYNHSYDPNAVYTRDFATLMINYTAIRPIAAGDEITINYNNDPSDQRPIIFDADGRWKWYIDNGPGEKLSPDRGAVDR